MIPETLTEFLSYLNSQHSRVKFTVEYANDGKLPYFGHYCTFITLVTTLKFQCTENQHLLAYVQSPLSFIRNLVYNYGFLKHFTETYIGKTLDNIINNKHQYYVYRRNYFIFLSFNTGLPNFQLEHKVSKLISEFYPNIKLKYL